MTTSEEIRRYTFEMTTDGNYDRRSVEEFRAEAAAAYEKLFAENKELAKRLSLFAKKLEDYKKNEDYMTDAMLQAQKSAAQTISSAEDVVAQMMDAAKNEGRNIINAAKEQAKSVYVDRDAIIADANAEAERIRAEAEESAAATIDDAAQKADELLVQTGKDNRRSIAEADEQASAIIRDAQDKAAGIIAAANTNAEEIATEARRQAGAAAEAAITAAVEERNNAAAEADAIRDAAHRTAAAEAKVIFDSANAAKTEAEALRAQAYEIKKKAVADAGQIIENAEREAEDTRIRTEQYVSDVNNSVLTESVKILLKTQNDADSVNSALDSEYARYKALKAFADNAYAELNDKFAEIDSLFNSGLHDINALFNKVIGAASAEAKTLPQTAEDFGGRLEGGTFTTGIDTSAVEAAIKSGDSDAVLREFDIDTSAIFADTINKLAARRDLTSGDVEAAQQKTADAAAAVDREFAAAPALSRNLSEVYQAALLKIPDMQTDAADAPAEAPAEPAETPEENGFDMPEAELIDTETAEEPAKEPDVPAEEPTAKEEPTAEEEPAIPAEEPAEEAPAEETEEVPAEEPEEEYPQEFAEEPAEEPAAEEEPAEAPAAEPAAEEEPAEEPDYAPMADDDFFDTFEDLDSDDGADAAADEVPPAEDEPAPVITPEEGPDDVIRLDVDDAASPEEAEEAPADDDTVAVFEADDEQPVAVAADGGTQDAEPAPEEDDSADDADIFGGDWDDLNEEIIPDPFALDDSNSFDPTRLNIPRSNDVPEAPSGLKIFDQAPAAAPAEQEESAAGSAIERDDTYDDEGSRSDQGRFVFEDVAPADGADDSTDIDFSVFESDDAAPPAPEKSGRDSRKKNKKKKRR